MPSKSAKVRLKAPRISIRTRAMRQNVLFAAFIVFSLSISSFYIARGFLEQRVLSQLSSIVAAKEDLAEQVLNNDRVRTVLIATRSDIRNIANGGAGGKIISDIFDRMREEHVPVIGISLFSKSGNLIDSSGLKMKTQPPSAQSNTLLYAVIDDYGWQEYEVFSPVYSDKGNYIGSVGLRYDSRPLLDILLSVSSVGKTGEVLLGAEQDGKLVLLHHRFQPQGTRTLIMGSIDDEYTAGSSLAKAVRGEESLGRARDYAGQDVYAAFRTLPSLGWGLVVKIARSEALEGTVRLAIFMGLIGAALILGSGFIAVILARKLTDPILKLSDKMKILGPNNWNFKRSVYTGDEVEILDSSAADLAWRLKDIYEHLEEKVEERAQEIHEQSAKDHEVMESIQYGIITIGKTGVILTANRAAGTLLGSDISDIIGTKIDETVVLCVKNQILSGKNHPAIKSLNEKKPARIMSSQHASIARKDGTMLPVTAMSAPLAEGENIFGSVLVLQDVTEERKVDYIKSEFISLASHQLRTPLSTIQWYLELFAEGNRKDVSLKKESLAEMQKAAQKMSGLLETLLHAARLEGGNINPDFKEVDMPAFLKDVAGEFKTRLNGKSFSFKADIPQKNLTVSTDPVLLHVILQNLLDNAVKYSQGGSEVGISLKRSGKFAEIRVKDNGAGIPKEEQYRVFERLFRASNAKNMDTTGSGLGLYISKMIAGIIGADLDFESAEGRGTMFKLKLPVK
ncbi:MAG: Sensor histidine kinase VicK [Candidatus Saccharibacteria bacterium GW2011_GWA2_46_10]|nr:MAG: Sensor histidine kinase VicK [Candidatus Saccharibacteria bacterium GW2011_GWA2_46_10]